MSENPKPIVRRERPPMGQRPMIGLRVPLALRASIGKWARSQPDNPNLSEATRRLIELGLQASKTTTGRS